MTSDARDLLSKLLEIDPTKRLTSTEALSHPWLTTEDEFVDEMVCRPRASSILRVDSTFRESFTRPTPPRKVPVDFKPDKAFKPEKDSSRSTSHHGLGIFRYVFGGASNDDKKIDTNKSKGK